MIYADVVLDGVNEDPGEYINSFHYKNVMKAVTSEWISKKRTGEIVYARPDIFYSRDYVFFTFTLTILNSDYQHHDSSHMKDELERKIAQRFKRHYDDNFITSVCPIVLSRIERHEVSMSKSVRNLKKKGKLTHFHGVIAISKKYREIFWDYELGCLDQKLQASLQSRADDFDVRIHPIIQEDSLKWVEYCQKDGGSFSADNLQYSPESH